MEDIQNDMTTQDNSLVYTQCKTALTSCDKSVEFNLSKHFIEVKEKGGGAF